MGNVVVVGMQWGDEGKGKVVDLFCPAFDAVARFQGGNNAGHTVRFGDRHFALHLVPSGILHPGMRCVAGNGMVVDPEAFLAEVAGLEEEGIEVAGRLMLSDRAHLLLPVHVEQDRQRESRRGDGRIGTTGRGIGPAYEAKVARLGMRAGELLAAARSGALEALAERADGEGGEELVERMRDWARRLEPYVRDTSRLLNGWIDEGRSVLFEGAQGALLDLDHGTYPYVTSSSSTAGGAATGTGVPPNRLGKVLGVLKAYTTRVGEGPFVGELGGEEVERLRQRGNEYGTTTGRPRRCGWLDTVVARYARRINGVDAIALTKLDVLDELESIPVLSGYRIGGESRVDFPPTLEELAEAEPLFETLPGWRRETVGTLRFEDLPRRAREYVEFIERRVGAPVGLVSTGPRREETILRREVLAGLELARPEALEVGTAHG